MPVYAKQYGRLGNNLFQKAAAIGYAMKHGLQYNLSAAVPKVTVSQVHSGKHSLRELGHNYQELPYDPIMEHDDIILDGFWQSEKYFAHCREEVLKAFNFDWFEANKEWCNIHVRRGDYLKYPDKHPVVTLDYLTRAMEMMAEHRGIERFCVCSDDIEWCQQNFKPLPYHFVYSTGRTEVEDLELISKAAHNIISNSTFSWWGAWFNRNPDKVVISPSKDNWFGPGNKHLDTSDLIPESWIQIKY